MFRNLKLKLKNLNILYIFHGRVAQELRQFILFIIALALVILVGCREKPEDLIEKARSELQKENRDAALGLLHQAFELSLGTEFHFRPINEKFSQLYVSRSGNRVLLIPRGQPAKSFGLYSDTGTLLRRGNTPAAIRKAGISPAGNFLIFLTQNSEESDCNLLVYDASANRFTQDSAQADCNMVPAISDSALFPYMREGKIFLQQNQTITEIKQKPDKPLAKMPAYPAFYFNLDNFLFFTYGSAGVYKFYYLDINGLKLIHKDITTSRITFNSEGLQPGVIIGGAGNMKMHFFDPRTLQATGKTWQTNAWNELVILDDQSRFYTENAALYEYQKGKDRELPFWASQLHALSGGRLLFLSATGSAMVYAGTEPPAGSIAIYKKGAELDERK